MSYQKVKEVYNRMIIFDSAKNRKGNIVKKNYQLISLDYIAKAHEFDYEEVYEMFKIIKKLK